MFDGTIKKGDEIKIVSTGKTFEVDKVGFFEPSLAVVEELGPGEVGLAHRQH